MASADVERLPERFVTINDDDLEALLDTTSSNNSTKSMQYSVRILNDFCKERSLNLEAISKGELNLLLKNFYASVRTQKNEFYGKKSMISIRYGIMKHFEKCCKFDIINDAEFKEANKVFSAMLVLAKKVGKGDVQHKSPLSKEDLRQLYLSFDLETPKGLQDKVFVDFMLYFCNRGRENIRELTPSDFIVDRKEQYIEMKDRTTKNHRGDIQDTQKSQGGRIYKSENNVLCPFTSFLKYLSVLNPECEAFFQRPKPSKYVKNSAVWFDNSPLGKNTLGNKMKTLSLEYSLSRQYTNHCLRATTITLLDIFEARHVMTVSGHKSECSLRSYARTDDQQKQRMALRILDTITGNADQGHDEADGIMADSRETPTLAMSTASRKSALASTSTNVQPTSDKGPDDFYLGFQFTASQETTLMADIPDMIAKDWGVPAGSTCASTQPIERSPPSVISSSRQMSSSIKHSAPIYIQNSTVHFH